MAGRRCLAWPSAPSSCVARLVLLASLGLTLLELLPVTRDARGQQEGPMESAGSFLTESFSKRALNTRRWIWVVGWEAKRN